MTDTESGISLRFIKQWDTQRDLTISAEDAAVWYNGMARVRWAEELRRFRAYRAYRAYAERLEALAQQPISWPAWCAMYRR